VNIKPPLVTKPGIVRYTGGQRMNHWLTALSFLLLAASGLAFFHPAFFPLVHLFGSPQWARILHPWIGVFMFCSFVILAIRMWSRNLWEPNDTQWMKQLDDEVMNRDELMPPIGKYNPGQKVLFFVMVASMGLLLLTGLVIWRSVIGVWIPWPIWLYRTAVLVHAFTAFVLIFGIIVHIYAALWVKGSIRAMVRGSVTHAWARHHHPGWYREVTGRSPNDLPPRERVL
jgi:formate dehydrogenase subunit gamma